MSRDNLNAPLGMDLDADAVCAQCGTVNPEGTLICKVCGNNLRDQRSLRMQTEQVLESVGAPPSSRRWITGVLFTVGALLILFVAFFVNNIASYMVSGGVQSTGAEALWYGEQHRLFDSLRDQAKSAKADADAVAAAIAAAAPPAEGTEPPPLDGVYVLMPVGAAEDAVPYGTAAVKMDSDEYAFAGVLADGTEVRGWATQRSSGLLTADAQRAASLHGGERVAVYGYAQRSADGYFNGFGQSADSESDHPRADSDSDLLPFVAYRLP